MRKFMKALTVAVAAAMAFVAAPAPEVDAQVNVRGVRIEPFKASYFSNFVSAADTEPVLVIKYQPGASTSATTATTVAVESDSNLTFVVNGAAYTGFECPVSGALGGVIDVSDAACNTLGEIVNVINSTAPSFATGYFRAAIVNGLASDDVASGGFLADAADVEVRSEAGEVVFWDSSTLDDTTVAANFSQSSAELSKVFFSRANNKLAVNPNPFDGQDSMLLYASERITNAGTIGLYQAYCVVGNWRDGGNGSESVRIMYSETGAATTALGEMTEITNGGGAGCNDGKILTRILASGADTSVFAVIATGYRATRN